MPIFVYGVSHKTAPIHLREQLALALDDTFKVLTQVRSYLQEIQEIMVLSTCQRIEWYFYADQTPDFISFLKDQFPALAFHSEAVYTFSGREAMMHMMRVANGLDSSLLGEPQILGQVKAAYATAKMFHFLGKHLEEVMQFIFATAKKVRHRTEIGCGAVSLPYTALKLGKCIFSAISNPYVLLIGAGTVIQTLLNHLSRKQNLTLVIANRSIDRALDLGKKYDAKAIQLEDLDVHLIRADIVISATGGPSQILSEVQVRRALFARADRALFMIDMAVPRDIAPEVASLSSVFLYNIDDLHQVVQVNLETRAQAAVKAHQIIFREVDILIEKLRLRQLGSAIRQFRQPFETLRCQLLETALDEIQPDACCENILFNVLSGLESKIRSILQDLPYLQQGSEECAGVTEFMEKACQQLYQGNPIEEVLPQVTLGLMNKLLHLPTVQLKAHIL